MIGHATVQTLLLVGSGLLANAVLEKTARDAEGPAPGSSVDEGFRTSPERGRHLGSLSWEEEPGGRVPAEIQPSITERTASGSLSAETKATEIIPLDSGIQMASGPQGATPRTEAADSAATPEAKAADRAVLNPQAPSTALPGLEADGKEARLSSAEEAPLREVSGIEDGQGEAYSDKTFLNAPGLPTQSQAAEMAEPRPFLKGSLSPDGFELRLTPVPEDVHTPTPAVQEAHSYLTPNTDLGRATMAVGPARPQPGLPGEEREPTPSQSLLTEQRVFEIAGVSGASHQDGELEKESRPLFADPEPSPTPLSGRVRMSAGPLDHTVSEDSAFGLDREETLFPARLPLLFDPLDDVDPEAMDTSPPGGSAMTVQPSSGMPAEAELAGVTIADADHSVSDVPPSDLLSLPWQMSGSEIPDAVTPPVLLSLTAPPSGLPSTHRSKDSEGYGTAEAATESHSDVTNAPPPSGTGQTVFTTVAKTTGLLPSKPGLELGLELEYEEEHDEEDEEDEDTEDSEEDESQEEETEAPVPPPTRPTYSRIPRPPLWVQRNHGLVRSWVEKIRGEAGYVSGMLAPVGIGIAGALVILGILYSIRAALRRRRNRIKQQRRKRRQMTSWPDQAMLLADSSEDEL